jgi:hypothetical protein
MKRWSVALFALVMVCASLAYTTPAQAKDMTGRFGLGADTPLGFFTQSAPTPAKPFANFDEVSVPGLSAVFQISEIIGLQMIFSFQLQSGDNAAGSSSLSYGLNRWGVTLRGIFATALSDEVNLGIVGGFTIMGQNAKEDGVGTFDKSATFFSAEAGLRPEWFITDYLSIHTQIGISFSLLDADNSGYSDGGFNLNFFQNADLLGNAGFTFWF